MYAIRLHFNIKFQYFIRPTPGGQALQWVSACRYLGVFL